MGLDRIPEVRTLRAKLSALCSQAGEASAWSGILAKEWMDVQALQAAGVYYADGHVRVYHGKLTKLPRRYMPGRGSACAAPPTTGSMPLDGQPFFLVTYPVDPGIVKVLREDIVPGLEREAGLQDAPGRGRRPVLAFGGRREGHLAGESTFSRRWCLERAGHGAGNGLEQVECAASLSGARHSASSSPHLQALERSSVRGKVLGCGGALSQSAG